MFLALKDSVHIQDVPHALEKQHGVELYGVALCCPKGGDCVDWFELCNVWK